MSNPNTAQFWNNKIIRSRAELINSPIFIHKNDIVTHEISTIIGRILDVGIGYGVIEGKLQDNGNIKLYGIDISDEAIRYAHEHFIGDFRIATSVNIPYAAGYFNCVFALDILEHLNNKQLLLTMGEIARVLKIGGKLIISVPINESFVDIKSNRHQRKYSLERLESELKAFRLDIYSRVFLTAFRKFYWIKHYINLILHIKSPNLLIVMATKK